MSYVLIESRGNKVIKISTPALPMWRYWNEPRKFWKINEVSFFNRSWWNSSLVLAVLNKNSM